MVRSWVHAAPALRRVLVLAAAPLLSLCVLVPAQAAALPDESSWDTADRRTELLLAKRVQERERALASLDRQAAEWSRLQAAKAAALSQLGYSGDPDEASVVMPLSSYRVSAGFGAQGPLWAADHTGQDFGADSGTTLFAMVDAYVAEVGDAGAYGLRTVFELPDGTEIWYCHQSLTLVAPGESVSLGEPVGLVGSTGNSTGPHLHLEVRLPDGTAVDPVEWMQDNGLEL